MRRNAAGPDLKALSGRQVRPPWGQLRAVLVAQSGAEFRSK